MNAKSIVSLSLCTLMVLQGMVSCMHRPSPGTGVEVPNTSLDRVDVTELGDRLRIEVEGGRPMTYSLSSSASPARVTVDLPGFSRGSQPERLVINKGPVLELTAQDVSMPKSGVQLVFALTAATEPDVHAQGTRLFIDFLKSHASEHAPHQRVSDASNAGMEVDGAPAMSQEATQGLPAKTLTRIDIQKSETVATIIIVADGELTYEAKRSSGDRLIVDVANVTSSIRRRVMAIHHPSIRQVRIGQHAKKVRLVFDLSNQTTYSIKPDGNQLAVHVTLQTEPGKTMSDTLAHLPQEQAKEKDTITPALVRTASAGSVPFPERLAMIHARPSLAQMATESRSVKEVDSEEIGQRHYAGRRISLDFQMADISNVLRLIAEVSGFNIVVGEGVKSKVTMKLVGVPWDQALDMLLKMNNLGMIREGNIVWIDSLANIAKQQDEEARAKESKSKAEDLVTRVIYVQNIAAAELQTTLRQYISPRGLMQVNQASNALVVRDVESQVVAFAELVRSLDLQVPQVQIEARIVQADTNYSRSLGVQWGISNTATSSNGAGSSFFGNPTGGFSEQQLDTKGTVTRSFLVNLPAAVSGLSSVPGAGFTFGKIGTRDGFSLDLRLSAGELLGLTKVIAAPKITTLDKREAKISQGESIPFQTTSLQGTQTTFVDANLELQVTPQITSRDPKEPHKQVLLKIRATRNAVGARSNPAGPSIDKREASTQVLVIDGETMVIGGIFVDTQTNTVAGLPYLSRIPVLGWLFKNKTESVAKQELLIFLTPTIVKTI
ncbi:MAG: putative Type pili biosis protein PilQ [Nitrospira sp.]|jgi:type IV pilus assembly protein PilQ|nr:putative Type pili biosis protein PilQ [Nitrospira sp.]